MRTSNELNELAAALAKAQCAFEAAERGHVAKVTSKKGEGSSYSFNYADLAAYLDVCRTPLGENGLSFVQMPTTQGLAVSVVTLLMHASGQFIESDPFTLDIATDHDGRISPQAVGSAVTYARRYSLSALIGMASEADDDGNAASGHNAETGPRQERQERPNCPKCGTNKATIESKFDDAGTWYCFPKKDGCGHKWQTVQQLAEQTGMTTGDKIEPPKDGKPKQGELSADEMELHGKYQRWFAACWTDDALRKVESRLQSETSQALKSAVRIAHDQAKLRAELLSRDRIDQDTMATIGEWMAKTSVIKDLETWMSDAMACDPCPFTEDQKRKLVHWFEKEQKKHLQTA